MSMQQALGAVGFVVGSYFGYPQLGFVVGSLVGGALTPAQKVEGPRIEDQKVTVSTEGTGIPRVWGAMRLGGNVVESTDKMEVSTTESQGKGGGGVESTTYRYYVNMRTVLCETRDDATYAVRKIWKDGKLVYDASSGTSVGSALASAENPAASLILYQGHEDQMPDPTEEARYGLGNVLAYRGVVSVVMNGIECPGGRVPQFSFELALNPSYAEANLVFAEAAAVADSENIGVVRKDEAWHLTTTGSDLDGTLMYRVQYLTSGSAVTTQGIYGGGVHYGLAAVPVSGDGPPTALRLRRAAGVGPTAPHQVECINLETGILSTVLDYIPGSSSNLLNPLSAGYDSESGKFAVRGDQASTIGVVSIISQGFLLTSAPIPGTTFGPVTIFRNVAYALSEMSGNLVLTSFDGDTGDELLSLTGPELSEGASFLSWAALHPSEEGIYVWAIGESGSQSRLYLVAPQAVEPWALMSTTFNTTGAAKLGGSATTIYASPSYGIIGPSAEFDGVHRYNLIRFQSIQTEMVDVATIISEECRLAGLSAEQFDVSSLAEAVHGYTISNPASARAGIQPLMTAFAIDATDEDGALKFFKRSDRTSVSRIGYDELGCVENGSEPGDPMPLTRANVTELYRSVTVSYINPDFDYQTSTEIARRQVTGATVDYSVEIAIAMSADQAATAAHRILYDNHNDRNRRSMKLSRKYADNSAGDVTTVEYPRGTLSDWRWAQATDTGALIEIEAVPADAELYTQVAVGGSGYAGQEVAPLPPPTRVVVMEGMPILRDDDDDAGVYVAMQGMGSTGYRGSTLLVGDADSVLEPRGSVTRSATLGFSESANVGPAVAFGFVDNTTQLIVNVGSGELHSATWEAMIVGGANVAALSVSYEVNGFPDALWEVFQFREATPLGNGRYLLTGLLRGLRGTEQVAYHHQVGDRFVLLNNAGMLHVSLEAGGIGSNKFYRGVSVGRSASTVDSVTAESTGYGLRPFSPVNVRRRSVSGAVVWTWDRRTRMQTNWQRGIVPLGEGSEAYEVVIYSDFFYSRIVRVIRAYAPTATYSASELLADGYTASGPIPYRIYQLSATVGRGIPYQPNQGLI